MIKILLVDDESHIRFILDEILADEGFITIKAANGKEAIAQAKKENPDVVLLDYQLPDMEGPEILKKIKEYNSNIIIIMLTAFGDLKKAVTCMKLGAFDYLTKPFDNDEIVMVINKALKNNKLENEVKQLRKKLEIAEVHKEKMGESRAIKKVLEMVDLVAGNDITVFLEGETGTGKEVIAKLIHQASQRSEKPFVAVDCGAIPESLFESEIFGHEKGAFTGALKTQIGKFEQADNGTLFLDEISNLPMNMQAKLLRVIQSRAITRVGGKKLIPVDIRIIAASNMDIISDVESGNFRSDLFYRLHEFKINLPKLTERKDDIPTLANFFLREFNQDFNKNISGFAPDTMTSMMKYNWPGNIRELRNLVKRAVLLAQGDLIFPKHILFIHLNKTKTGDFEEKNSFDDISIQALKNRIKVIQNAIEKANGNKSKAASNLGITRNQLYRLLNRAEKLGI
ncbi:MAG: sigma-54 dependent transcriptional regulator [Candidatus Cloacimonetes bacterium]|nr:sigma-54 dependent transcriptional regulator [Candidatus Cloacimonadota bacterium]